MHGTSRRAAVWTAAILTVALATRGAPAIEYPHETAEPQKTGWPLSDEEREYVLRAEHERRPGSEANRHLPELWPVVPSAGFWGGTGWLDCHAGLVKRVEEARGPVDVLLVGDSITQQWGDAWVANFPTWKAVNVGIGGDKTQNVLWRLDHGGVDGLEPRVCVLLIGNNNMFFTPETGIDPVAKGIAACAENLRERFPGMPLVVVKVFPAHAPGDRFYEDIEKVNAALDRIDLQADADVRVLDLWDEMVDADGSLRGELFTSDSIHLSRKGYDLFAAKLRPLLEAALAGGPAPTPVARKRSGAEMAHAATARPAEPAGVPPAAASDVVIDSDPVLRYAYAPYNDGRMDPQLSGWPLSADEMAWVSKGEYTRKPGHEVGKHLPEMWTVTPSAAHWGADGGANAWIGKHAACLERARAMTEGIDVAVVGDSITEGWGGVDGPWNAAWRKHFPVAKSVNLGIAGDRTENLLWRLDHGLLDVVPPKVVVLMIGVNDANLVHANGVPVAAAVEGVRLCVANIRLRCPASGVVVVKLLPAFDPGRDVGARVVEMNAALGALHLETDPLVRVVDPWADFTTPAGALDASLYSDGHLHLSAAGYEVLAARLAPAVEALAKEVAVWRRSSDGGGREGVTPRGR